LNTTINVKLNQNVRGGITVIAVLPDEPKSSLQ